MIERPERQVEAFAKAGADVITIHPEATPHIHYALKLIRELGCAAGVVINPGTPVEAVEPVAEIIDLCLVMSVNPGWGGQRYIPSSTGPPRPAARAASRPRWCSRSTAGSRSRRSTRRATPAPSSSSPARASSAPPTRLRPSGAGRPAGVNDSSIFAYVNRPKDVFVLYISQRYSPRMAGAL